MPHPLRPSPSRRLRRLLADKDTASWWSDVDTAAGPLVEAADDEALVTFTWRDDRQDGEVLLLLNGVVDHDRYVTRDVSPHALDRVPGTDVWYATYRLPWDLRATYAFYPCDEIPACDNPTWMEVVAAARVDPVNPVGFAGAFGSAASLLELPDAPAMPYAWARPEVPRGRVTTHTITGRRVWAYVPPGHDPAAGPYPLAVFLDGDIWTRQAPLAPTLDGLITAGEVPPLVAVLVDSGDSASRNRDMACSDDFVAFLTDAVLPWARGELAATGDPRRTVLAGQSFGGLFAAYAALVASDSFGLALCQSGSFYWPWEDEERLVRRFADHPAVPVRFFLQSGRHEWVMLPGLDSMCEVLRQKGYDFTRRDFTGGHDRACWLQGLHSGLTELLS